MRIDFHKYQGTGNDFIIIDNRSQSISLDQDQAALMCHRRFGIGADGIILLELEPGADFKMTYFNSDGNAASFCGNGGRCVVAFARQHGIISDNTRFMAADGLHEAAINGNDVALKMQDVKQVETGEGYFYLDTGSPHYVLLTKDVAHADIVGEGRRIRNSERFRELGTNVNFIEKVEDELFVRTYERGVEDETFSCGTGVTAVALVAAIQGIATGKNSCVVKTLGGNLEVTFERVLEQNFYNIWLKGPAMLVYKGSLEL